MLHSTLLKSVLKFATQASPQQKSTPNFTFAKDIPTTLPREHMNLFQSINSAIDIALATDHTYFLDFMCVGLRFLGRMSNLEVFFDVPVGYWRNMGSIGYSIRRFRSRGLRDLRLGLLWSDIRQLLRSNSVIIFFLLSIRLLMKLLSIGSDLVDNSIVVVLLLGPLGALWDMEHSITRNLPKPILHTLLD